jgi:sec-independent protein translocase protein TatA
MLPNLGYGELFIILMVALLVFGAKRIPEIAKSFGKAINSFKSGMKEGLEEGDKNNEPPEGK